MQINRIKNLNTPELDIYTELNEKQVKRLYEPDPGIFICESDKVVKRALKAGYEPLSALVEDSKKSFVEGALSNYDIPIYLAEHDTIQHITGYALTGGVLVAMRRKKNPGLNEITQNCDNIVILDDVENPTNVGAIFRSAAALGAEGILLTEGSADPLYRRAARVSMGSVFSLKWAFTKRDVAEELKNKGYTLYALSLSDNSKDLSTVDTSAKKKAVILGNEDHGISPEILKACNHEVIIPMDNGVDSLNVAAASAVAFWELFK